MKIYCYWTSCPVSFIWLPSFLRVLVHAGFVFLYIFKLKFTATTVICFFIYSLPSNVLYWVLFSFYGTPGDRFKLVLNLHSWKTIYLKIIALFLSSFLCTAFIFLTLRRNITSGAENIIRFWIRFTRVFLPRTSL